MMPEAVDNTAGNAPPAQASPQAASPVTEPPPRHAAETARLYAADWTGFASWCANTGRSALPAAPATVAAFLAAAAGEEKCSAGALGRRAAAIAHRHRQAGFSPPPTADPAVREILRAARRAATPRRPPPPRPAQLLRMAAACPGDFSGIRDRALLLLTATGFFSRAALVGLDAEQLRFTATAVALAVPQAGSDRDLRRDVVVPRGAILAACPVQALRAWLETSDTRFGPVFRKIDRWGTIEPRRLGTDALRRIFVRRRTPRRRRRTGQAPA